MRILLLGLLLFGSPTVTAIVVTDDLGRRLELAQSARRIVSLAPHLTELLFAAGAGDMVVGSDIYSDYPPAAQRTVKIGSSASLDRERILSLQPDLIIAWDSGNSRAEVQALIQLGLPVFVSELRELEQISAQIRLFGRLAGTQETADKRALALEKRFSVLATAQNAGEPLRVFYQISSKPLFTVNGQHLISRVIALCGGKNVFHNLQVLAPNVSVESVLASQPDVILYGTYPGEEPGQVLNEWMRWAQLAAVPDRILAIDSDLINRPGPRLADGADQVCRALQQARSVQDK